MIPRATFMSPGARVLLASLVMIATAPSAAGAALRPAPVVRGVARVRLDGTGPSYYQPGPADTLTFQVAGPGRMRIRSRSLSTGPEAVDFVRYGVAMGDTVRRAFRRTSAPEREVHLVPVAATTVEGVLGRIGEEDVLDLEVPSGVKQVRVWRRGRHPALIRVLLDENLYPRPASRSTPRSGAAALTGTFEVAGLGYDSNPYLAPKESGTETAKAFWPVALDLRYEKESGRSFSWRVGYGFRGDFYGDSDLNANRHELLLREQIHTSGSPWSWRFDQRFRSQLDTFVGRGETDEFEASVGTGTVPLGDRFNYLEFDLEAEATRTLSDRMSLSPRIAATYRDYREDYDSVPTIYALDQTRLLAGLGLDRTLSAAWDLGIETDHELRLYREKFSRDRNGVEVPEEHARFSQHSLGVRVDRRPRAGLTLRFAAEGTLRIDQFDGYWDYRGLDLTTGIGWRWRPGHRVNLDVDYAPTYYQNATVGYDPLGVEREKKTFVVDLSARYRLRRWIDFEAGYEYRNRSNNSPTFAYRRSTVQGGLAVRF